MVSFELFFYKNLILFKIFDRFRFCWKLFLKSLNLKFYKKIFFKQIQFFKTKFNFIDYFPTFWFCWQYLKKINIDSEIYLKNLDVENFLEILYFVNFLLQLTIILKFWFSLRTFWFLKIVYKIWIFLKFFQTLKRYIFEKIIVAIINFFENFL